MQYLDTFYILLILFFLIQGIVNIMLSLYAWGVPERIDEVKSPQKYSKPAVSFSVLLPARHEQKVIGETILSIFNTNYPRRLVEILIVCGEEDIDTIEAAKKTIIDNNIKNAKIISFNDYPINKPHGLNAGLRIASKHATVIFDAEDSVNPDIFNIANTLFLTKRPDIIQAGVQLMNYGSRWFSSHNVLEYYFWFRSRMHFHTKIGMVPLGGNTVFFITKQLREAGGWDEKCLTEDCEIGIRLSANGARIISTYDPQHVTKEETPLTVSDFIKQRTRWNQGFIQVLQKKDWTQFNSLTKRVLCLYTLSFPFMQTILFLATILIIVLGIEFNIPVIISWLSFTPLLIIFSQICVNCLGLHEFAQEQKLKLKWRVLPLMTLTFFFYQLLLGISAIRATYRQIAGQQNWEKTTHLGQHRIDNLVPIEETVGMP